MERDDSETNIRVVNHDRFLYNQDMKTTTKKIAKEEAKAAKQEEKEAKKAAKQAEKEAKKAAKNAK